MPPLFIYPIRPRYWSSYKKKSRNPATYRKEREPAYCEKDSSDIFLKKFRSPTEKKAQSRRSINACQINLKKIKKFSSVTFEMGSLELYLQHTGPKKKKNKRNELKLMFVK
jgi:hypothetical protein